MLEAAPAPAAGFQIRTIVAASILSQRAYESVRFVPVASNTYVDFEGHRQCRRLRHVGT